MAETIFYRVHFFCEQVVHMAKCENSVQSSSALCSLAADWILLLCFYNFLQSCI